ncbi:CRT (chloroquine-resistance transporter)-like transporter 3 [Actinidia rufa]|uniref:CRT (Chloroquine-resistance transporter)-like transporter 3 n=1 Tax=Actinidia rufa TaxID=165716 RepID=A0A7J0F6G0_9ERIC|nr:CRT (chloroquine-resistance transporter)-like transporter 3 [Actinidia rufa]
MSASHRLITAKAAASAAAARQIQLRTAAAVPLLRGDRGRGFVVLRSPRRLCVIKAAAGGGISYGCGGGKIRVRPCSYAVGDQRAVEDLVEKGGKSGDRTAEVLVAAGVTVVLGVGNRVLYKLALVPLKHYPFFLAQLATFGYVLVYFSILYLRYHAGIVTDEMLSLPKAPYLAVGLLEALGAASGMAAGAILSGAAIPILSQGLCLVRGISTLLQNCENGSSAGSLMEAGVFWSLLMIVSFLFQAADTVLKGRSVDLFVVNSYGSAFQALFICLLLPFLSKLWGIPFYQLPNYLKDGCDGAPLLPLLFVIVNMGFNISLLHLLKISSAVVSCLASTVSGMEFIPVPVSVFLFTLPLPYLGVASSLPPGFVAGAVVLLVGMFIYTCTPLLGPSVAPPPPQPSVD